MIRFCNLFIYFVGVNAAGISEYAKFVCPANPDYLKNGYPMFLS